MPHSSDHIKPASREIGSVSAPVSAPAPLRRFPGFKTPGPAKAFLAKVRDVVLPSQCLGCSVVVEAPDTLCGDCWGKLAMIGPAACQCCGLPFEFDLDAPLCGECVRLTPPFARARSAVIYDEGSRHLIMAFKHGDRPEAAKLFARWMASAAADLLRDADVLVPVPLDRRRLFKRRFNQAALMAKELSQTHGIPISYDAVERIRPTPSQGHLSPAQRRRNVAGAFAVPESGKSQIAGKRVLLIDDVLTTGATVWAVTRQLNKAGAIAVDVLTTARVVRSGSTGR
ncbi:MAG: ComF family protein [Rhodospirillales bacterium]|jgi:ComF family protein|nr:ComF family protein [Rhodospirillales bacterium]MBT4040763.1 ComF family protein [Rhodospirillales bacterium]MBT4625948.1 ComF family protein [Rhodospirillales bacterium]MBT5350697.1 ComF family protein [Rhodospirillales bacterium]MBT5522059.1 ComF family protein [Rhodospirillales bacterium]